ncbi:type III-A CRISPR-associated CARF protein Csm6 [Streptococcus tangpeifui]|uniref:type III-A CRISPR-associated CARF protein Csm6 n=1 Tax=Streptococcus tangpeifui TaxID=2709400 RepID=UPI0013ECECD1|nr:type III-A CRISPR-associated CARF protein Csm6 [Streptococcus sp. ZJ1593]
MKVLISAVGDTDPIRGNHDGPLLHISRHYRPERIILIYSEGMIHKKKRIEKAILSIPDYHPEIVVDSKILADNDVFRFDRMYEQLLEIINKHINEDDEFLLNLSSATAQVTSAMFTINKINNLNVRAIQVPTPRKGSNRNNPDDQKDIELLISENKDACQDAEKRIIEEDAEKFSQSLIKRNLRELIIHYDYQGAYELLLQKENKKLISYSKRAKLLSQTEKLMDSFKYQKILPDLLEDAEATEKQRKVFNSFLLIDIINRRGLIADVLIKSKSLAEFVLQDYIDSNYSDLILTEDGLPKINENHPLAETVNNYISDDFKARMGENYDDNKPYDTRSTLNIHSFINIIDCLEKDNQLTRLVKPILVLNAMRNKIAHGLSEIDRQLVNNKKLKELLTNLKQLVISIYNVDESYFDYFEEKNKYLFQLLN